MTTTTLNKGATALIAIGTNNAAGATTRGAIDLHSAQGGMLTIKIANGATGPTTQAVANILIAHNATTPTLASANADWKTIQSVGGGVGNSVTSEWAIPIDPAVMQLEVEITGNTGQAVTCEAIISAINSATSA